MRAYLAAVLTLAPLAVAADQEGNNEPVVSVSEYGDCYGKSVPAEDYGEKGETRIYRVERRQDLLVQTHPWYARTFFVDCSVGEGGRGVSVVQLGPWPRGRAATAKDLAIAFYLNGRLVKRYSTLDIAGEPSNVRATSHHHKVISKTLGYRWGSGRQRFVIQTVDGRTIVFDAELGTRVTDKLAESEQP